jgi:ATP-binding cassette, subfamily F, member 3
MAKAAREAGNAKVKARKEKGQAAEAAPKPADRKASGQARQKAAEQTKPLRTELSTLEKKLALLTQEKTNIEAAAAQTGLSPAQRVEQGKRLKQISDDTERAEGRWLELTTEIDALTTGEA